MAKGDLRKQIDRINYIAGYVVNESPTYRPIMDSSSFDSIPEEFHMKEADATAPSPEPAAAMPSPTPSGATGASPTLSAISPMPSTDAAPTMPAAPAPEMPQASTPPPMPEPPPMQPEPMAAAPMEPSAEDLQKEVMRFQLDAMKKMSQKIDQLEGIVSSLNSQQAELHSEVEKVKDPSDVEKFAERKQDSSPYYFNLNDMWNGNTFQARMDNFNSKGITKTEDGYVADFDQLPKLSQYQVKDSFEQI